MDNHICTDIDDALRYLRQNWAEIPFGGAYPGSHLDTFGRDIDLVKVRTPLRPDRKKSGVIMAFTEGLADQIPDIIEEFAETIGTPVEYRLASDGDMMTWHSIPITKEN